MKYLKHFSIVLLVCVAGLTTTGSCNADVIYDLFLRIEGDRNGLDNAFDVSAGEIVAASAILRETITGSEVSPFEADTLSGAVVRVFSSAGNDSFRNVTTDTEGGFEGAQAQSDPTIISFQRVAPPFNFGDGKPATLIDPVPGDSRDGAIAVRELTLGTVELVAPTVGATRFSLTDANPTADGDFGTLTTPSLEVFARSTGGQFFYDRGLTLTVTAIPEPGTFGLLAMCVTFAALRRRRR